MPRNRKTKQNAKRLNTPIPDHVDIGIEKMARKLKVSRNDVVRHCMELCVIGDFKECQEVLLKKLNGLEGK